MNCPKCDSKIASSFFCANCGTLGSEDFNPSLANESSGSPSERATAKAAALFGSRRNRAIGLGLVTIISATILYVVVPSKVVFIELFVEDRNGGAFSNNCTIEEDAKSLIPTSIEVRPVSSSSQGSIHTLEYFPAAQGGCVGRTSISVAPFSNSEVRDRQVVIGKIGAQEIGRGEAVLAKKVALERNLTVNFTLTDVADSCSTRSNGWYCSWSNDWSFGLQLNEKNSTGKGKNGYNDIKDGTSVTVTGLENGKSSTSVLTGDSYDLPNVKTKQIVCRFKATLSGIPNDPGGYSVEVSKRGKVNFTIDDLRDSYWKAEVTLGN